VIQVNKAKPARRPAGVTRARDPKVANGSAQTTMERFARVARLPELFAQVNGLLLGPSAVIREMGTRYPSEGVGFGAGSPL